MELQDRKEHVLRSIQLGLDLYSACILAGCTEEETELLEADQEFNKRVLYERKKEELALLRDHSTARGIAAEKGNTKPIEWMLEKLNPEQWGKAREAGDTAKLPKFISLIGIHPDDDDGSENK